MMDFNAMFQTWLNVLTRPGEEVFQEEKQKEQATINTALIWVVISAVIAAIFSVFAGLISAVFNVGTGMAPFLDQLEQMDPMAAEQLGPLLGMGAEAAGFGFAAIMTTFCLTLILAPIGFLISSGIYFVVAKLFGGTGEFEEQTYLLATFTAPMTIVNSVISLVPLLGLCISFFLFIYQIVLTFFAIKVSHNLTTGRAVGVVLIPIAIFLLVICCIAFFVGSIIGGLAGADF